MTSRRTESNTGELLSHDGVPLAVSLDDPHATGPAHVGACASLLATARRLGLPVAPGVGITTTGVIAMSTDLRPLRHAWEHTRGPARIMLSSCGPQPCLSGPSADDCTTWSGLLSALCGLLWYDEIENPGRCAGTWGIVVLKVPVGRSTFVTTGPDRQVTIHGTRDVRARARLAMRAIEASAKLARPLDLEFVTTDQGRDLIVDLRLHTPPRWPGPEA